MKNGRLREMLQRTEPAASLLGDVTYWLHYTLGAFCKNMTSIDFCLSESWSHGFEIRQVRHDVNGANDQVTRSLRLNSVRGSVLFKDLNAGELELGPRGEAGGGGICMCGVTFNYC